MAIPILKLPHIVRSIRINFSSKSRYPAILKIPLNDRPFPKLKTPDPPGYAIRINLSIITSLKIQKLNNFLHFQLILPPPPALPNLLINIKWLHLPPLIYSPIMALLRVIEHFLSQRTLLQSRRLVYHPVVYFLPHLKIKLLIFYMVPLEIGVDVIEDYLDELTVSLKLNYAVDFHGDVGAFGVKIDVEFRVVNGLEF